MKNLSEKDIEDLISQFENMCNHLRDKVSTAARNRYSKGIPALTQQSLAEHYEHMDKHVINVLNDDIGDEASVHEQVLHATCRALLANFSYEFNNGINR